MAQEQDVIVQSGSNELEIIEFYINEKDPDSGTTVPRYFGVNVAKVLEVINNPGLTVPQSAPHPSFLGVIPLRDMVLPVIDLSRWLTLSKVDNKYEVILVTQFSDTINGFLVSGVTMIHRVSWKDVEPPNQFIADMPANCITGMVEIEGRFVLLLDFEKIIGELDPEFGQDGSDVQTTATIRYKALVVDDSATMRLVIREKLELANFEVTVAENGEMAWETLNQIRNIAETEQRPVTDYLNIVVSDIEMPLMDGYTLTRRIKGAPEFNRVPVALFSSLITPEQRQKGDAVGADEQVTKPQFGKLAVMAIDLIEKTQGRA